MDSDIQNSYHQNLEFWKKDSPRIQGDIEQRPLAVAMLEYIFEKLILDAGCGTGYVTRMVKERGADVIGFDNSEEMLKIARKSEKEMRLGIDYRFSDITEYIRARPESFDGAISVGVVHHFSPDEYVSFLIQVGRVLKPESPLVISLVHPSMFYRTSPARTQKRCWVKLYSREVKSMDQSQQFMEELYDIDGNPFDSTLWYHPTSFLFNALSENGFRVEQVNEPIFRKEHMLTPAWGDSYGYPTHLQIRAVKDGGQIK